MKLIVPLLCCLLAVPALAQPITGVWRGKFMVGKGMSAESMKVEIKLIKSGDSLFGTAYYYASPSRYIRYAVRGHFDEKNNTVVWRDDKFLGLEPPGKEQVGIFKEPMESNADFNCPGNNIMMLDGTSHIGNGPHFSLHFDKVSKSLFNDEWDNVIEGYFTGMDDPQVIDSVYAITTSYEPDPITGAIASNNKPAQKKPAAPTNETAKQAAATATVPVVTATAGQAATGKPASDAVQQTVAVTTTEKPSQPVTKTDSVVIPATAQAGTKSQAEQTQSTTSTSSSAVQKSTTAAPAATAAATSTANQPPVTKDTLTVVASTKNNPPSKPAEVPPAGTAAVTKPPAVTTSSQQAATPPVQNNTKTQTTAGKTTVAGATSVAATTTQAPPPATKQVTAAPVQNTAKTQTAVSKPPVTAVDAGTAVASNNQPQPAKTQTVTPSFLPVKVDTVAEKLYVTRQKITQGEIPVSGDSIELSFYDNAEVDGDSISVFLNGRLLFNHVLLTAQAHVIKIPVSEIPDNSELTMVAENLGTIPPNTSLMLADIEGQRYSARIESTEKTSGVIKLVRRKQP